LEVVIVQGSASCRTRIRWPSTGRRSNRSVSFTSFSSFVFSFLHTLPHVKTLGMKEKGYQALQSTRAIVSIAANPYIPFLFGRQPAYAHLLCSSCHFLFPIPFIIRGLLSCFVQNSCLSGRDIMLVFCTCGGSRWPICYFTVTSSPNSTWRLCSQASIKALPRNTPDSCVTHLFP
jgi:hypothetical protein